MHNKNSLTRPCPCGSKNNYQLCCHPFHSGAIPKTALELMKARYSAYVLNIPSFIIKTTHPASPQYEHDLAIWTEEISSFSLHSIFEGLEIVDHKEQDSLAIVTFIAHMKQKEQDATFTEKSYFEKKYGQWFYKNGQLYAGKAPNIVTINEMKILPLAYYGDPILRIKATPVTEITEALLQLIEEMKETMQSSGGIGLAAPQVHHSIRLFLARLPEPNFENGPIEVFINPILSDESEEKWSVSEGCLSLPTIHGPVERPQEITIEYVNEHGEKKKRRAKGWEARVLMHENDHLDGHFFIDHLSKESLEEIKEELIHLNQRIHDPLAL